MPTIYYFIIVYASSDPFIWTSKAVLHEKQAVTNLNSRVEDLSESNSFLSKHVDALEQENAEQHQRIIINNNNNNNNNGPTTSNAAKSNGDRKVLGTKKFSELGQGGKNKTRAAYKEKAQELNVFGENRGLVVNFSLIISLIIWLLNEKQNKK